MGFRPAWKIQEAEGSELVAAQEKDARIEKIRRTIQEMQEIETWQAEVEHLSKCAPNSFNLHQEAFVALDILHFMPRSVAAVLSVALAISTLTLQFATQELAVDLFYLHSQPYIMALCP